MTAPSRCVAGIDIGTNSVRLLVRDEAGTQLVREMRITRLGQGVDATGRLQSDAMERTLSVLSEYAALCRAHEVSVLRMTATSAARDASNRDAFFDAVQRIVGSRPELLPGSEEAALSFAGATVGLPRSLAPFLVFDIGGGSTEFALGVEEPTQSISVNMGGVRLTEKFLASDPPAPAEMGRARDFVREQLELVAEAIDATAAKTWLGLAGTVTSIAAIALGLSEYDPSRTHGFLLGRDKTRDILARLAEASVAERRRMLLQPQRAEVIVGGGIVLLTVMETFGLDVIRVSESDILDGLAASALGSG